MTTKRKPRIYVAGPYTAGDQAANVKRAIDMGDELMRRGFAPYVPHLNHFWQLAHLHTYDEWMELDEAFLAVCDAVYRIEGYSLGASQEEAYARANGIPIFREIPPLLEYFHESTHKATG